jgi:hypothetical protein
VSGFVETSGTAAEVIRTERIGSPRNLSFDTQDWAILAKCWYPVGRSDELGDKPIQAQLLDVDLVVYRSAGRAIVARNLCVHRGTQLSLGWVEDDVNGRLWILNAASPISARKPGCSVPWLAISTRTALSMRFTPSICRSSTKIA